MFRRRDNSSSRMMGYGEGMDKLEYVDALEKELRKIEVFHRELPLAVQLVRRGNHDFLCLLFLLFDFYDC